MELKIGFCLCARSPIFFKHLYNVRPSDQNYDYEVINDRMRTVTSSIVTSSQDDSFFGSDFSYDHFGGLPDLDDYTFRVEKENVIDGKPCYVVEVKPRMHCKYTLYIA
jgi:hypothetical protein